MQASGREVRPLTAIVDAALSGIESIDSLAEARPVDERDGLLTLLAIHDLHVAPIERLAGTERFQHHPGVAALKGRLESDFLASVERDDAAIDWSLPDDPVAAFRAVRALGLVPPIYRWLCNEATADELVEFLALEGGPDGGFDDLVAACQIGLSGEAKLEMARNYWDEMGNGRLDRVHTELHNKLLRALQIDAVPRQDHPIELLRRSALGSTLATNRRLQPEMVGALGLLELQAGPRCRQVVAGLKRLGAGPDALDFYDEHAVADPRHGKDWLDNVIASLADQPRFAEGMVRGARWRSLTNARFFDAMAERFDVRDEPAGRLAS